MRAHSIRKKIWKHFRLTNRDKAVTWLTSSLNSAPLPSATFTFDLSSSSTSPSASSGLSESLDSSAPSSPSAPSTGESLSKGSKHPVTQTSLWLALNHTFHLTLSHLQIAYALVWLYLHSRHWKYPVYRYLHSQEEKHRNANTIIEIVVTRKVYNLHLTNFTRCTSRLYTTHKCWSMCMKLMF